MSTRTESDVMQNVEGVKNGGFLNAKALLLIVLAITIWKTDCSGTENQKQKISAEHFTGRSKNLNDAIRQAITDGVLTAKDSFGSETPDKHFNFHCFKLCGTKSTNFSIPI